MGHCVLLYLMNLGIQNFFGTTTFGTRHISAALTGSYKSTPSIPLILASNAAILSRSMLSDDLALRDSLSNAFMTVGAGVGDADYTNAGLC